MNQTISPPNPTAEEEAHLVARSRAWGAHIRRGGTLEESARRAQNETDFNAGYEAGRRSISSPGVEEIERALKPLGWQDIRLVAGEGVLPGHIIMDAVNIILKRRADDLRARAAYLALGGKE